MAPEDSFIEFPEGVPGFPDHDSWVVVVRSPESVFGFLQATDTPSVSLPVVIPWVFRCDFELQLTSAQIESLELTDARDVEVLTVVNVKEQMERSTVNLFSPIVINRRLMVGGQMVNGMSGYSTRDALITRELGTPVSLDGWGLPMARYI